MKNIDQIINNKQLKILSFDRDGSRCWIRSEFTEPITLKRYFVVFTSDLGWEHASVSQKTKTPSWDIMCRIKDIFWNEDECCVEYHPKKEDYVNNHEHCLHIWKPIEMEIPTPPSIMVGIKGMDSGQAHNLIKYALSVASKEDIKRLAEQRGIKANRDLRRGNR